MTVQIRTPAPLSDTHNSLKDDGDAYDPKSEILIQANQ